MKTQRFLKTFCISAFIMLAAHSSNAQSVQAINAPVVSAVKAIPTLTYKTFQAPNKMYGYDIFKDGKIIFHQGASLTSPNNPLSFFTSEASCDKAALMSVEKIKNNQPPALTNEEIKKITLQ